MTTEQKLFINPYRPGAGHMPPFLAGRRKERAEFERLLKQETILENMVLTGLRGVGKTVLLDTFKPTAIATGWRWVGTDLSESASLTEATIATRLLADLSTISSTLVIGTEATAMGFDHEEKPVTLDYSHLTQYFHATPGLISDKLKAVLEYVWSFLRHQPTAGGMVFAYDEAQNLADHAEKDQFPLSLLLDTFQSIQKKGIPFMLVLTGLPTLFPKLVEARTFAERMFRVVFLDRLTKAECEDAILKPSQMDKSIVTFATNSVKTIVKVSGGYPYFVQFICREVFDIFLQQLSKDETLPSVPIDAITAKLDTDFFAGRWSRATDRQRELLRVIASLDNCDAEFTVQEVVERSKELLAKPFSSSHTNQMLLSLSNSGLVFKNRHGKYSFAVPLMGQFINRQYETQTKGNRAIPENPGDK